ncbi:PLP-dependent aminotransferase family protein [Actinocorallia longicatena]|uniref:PLP-dependent aminotransferase family protein n=1 Tax=Actinocorallia longicatena TaxID=111803 RepID=A0ABP6Q0U2_9ACTN
MSETRYVSGLQVARLLGEVPHERPVYVALARGLRGLIQDGKVALRVRLPAERDLATALGVSRTTVTAAYDALREDGYITSRQGAGSWTALPLAQPLSGGAPRFTAQHGRVDGMTDLGCAAPAAPEVFAECVEAAVRELPRYSCGAGYEPNGVMALRVAIAERYTRRGLPTRPEEIVVTTGAQHACALLFRTLANSGDTVMVERPTYPHALSSLRDRGARLVPVGVHDGWDVELMGAAMRQAAARLAYTVPDFQNPTGHLMAEETREGVVAAARAAQAQVISDETFAELEIDVPPVRPMACFDAGGRVISVGSASKLFWGGLRVGWIRTSIPLAARLAVAREPMDIGTPILDQLIVAELFQRIEEVRAERRRLLLASRDALVDALNLRLPEWTFTVPGGGMSLWVRLPAPVAVQVSEAALRRGVRIVPGPVFGVDGVLEDCFRIPFVLTPDVLTETVDRLAAAYADIESLPLARPLPAYV